MNQVYKTKVIQNINQAKDGEIVYDIDEGVFCIEAFIKETKAFTKEYKKLTKKMDGANPSRQKNASFKFSNKNLREIFERSLTGSYFKNEELSYLEDNEINTYIVGLFIAGNSQEPNIKNNISKIYAHTLKEITEKVFERVLMASHSQA